MSNLKTALKSSRRGQDRVLENKISDDQMQGAHILGEVLGRVYLRRAIALIKRGKE
jgi:hypothetical protein